MGDGIRKLAQGLVLSLRAKAERLKLTMADQMASEAAELETMLTVLYEQHGDHSNARRSSDLDALIGLVFLFKALMQPSASGGLSRESFEAAVLSRAERLDERMMRFENVFESNPALPLHDRLTAALISAIG